jgi:asparagine synthase (glutamine-hydrolysing)
LYFSSEAKSLLLVDPELRELDMKGLGEVFSFGCVLENRTLFSDVFLLPPGSVWTHGAGNGLRKESYFKPDIWENQPFMEEEAFYQEFKETFVSILPGYLNTPRQTALSLTGGLDTRMILACMTVPPGALPCYTFGGMGRDSFDVKISRRIAEACHQPHEVLALGRDFFSEFPRLAEKTVYVTDGCLNVSGSVELYVNRLAKEIAPVRLTGNYGSEILRGARDLEAQPARRGLFEGAFEECINSAAVTLGEHCRGHRITFAAFMQAPWYQYRRLALEQSQLTLRSPFLDNDLVRLMYRAPAAVLDSSSLSWRLIREANPRLANIMTDRGVGGGPGALFTGLASLYREFLFKGDYAFDYGMPQWLASLDHGLLAPLHVERLFLGWHKFYHFRVWFRDQLSGYVKEVLLDPGSLKRPYLNGRFAEKMVLDHTSGRLNYTAEINTLLTVELLQRLMIEGRESVR